MLGQAFPQLPQLDALVLFVSHPTSGLPVQCAYPGAHAPASNTQVPAMHAIAPLTLGRFVQSWPQLPQLRLPFGTHPPSHTRPEHPASGAPSSAEASGTLASATPSSIVAPSEAASPGPAPGIVVASHSGSTRSERDPSGCPLAPESPASSSASGTSGIPSTQLHSAPKPATNSRATDNPRAKPASFIDRETSP